MINLNTPNKLSSGVKWYELTRLVTLILILSLLVSFLFSKLEANIFPYLFFGLLFVIGLPKFLYFLLYYNSVSFIVGEKEITINSGILSKHSRAIPFSTIQSVENSRPILYRLFGISGFNIWTSSPEQVRFSEKGVSREPDGRLELSKSDGKWLKDFILSKRP